MHIVVCIKQVPDTTQARIDPKTNTLIREGMPTIVNPYDMHALEEGVRIKEEYGAKVTVLTMGPPQARDALREGISHGCDAGVLLTDRAFAGSDTLATSYILSEAIRRIDKEEKVDLVICGKQSIDGDTAQVGPGIAQRLDLSQLTYVIKLRSIDIKKKSIVVERQLENGRQVVEARLPALMTVVKEINEMRYSSLSNLIKAAKYEPIVWNLEVLGLDIAKIGLKGSPTTVRKIFPPPPREAGEIINKDGEDAKEVADRLVKLLIEDEVI